MQTLLPRCPLIRRKGTPCRCWGIHVKPPNNIKQQGIQRGPLSNWPQKQYAAKQRSTKPRIYREQKDGTGGSEFSHPEPYDDTADGRNPAPKKPQNDDSPVKNQATVSTHLVSKRFSSSDCFSHRNKIWLQDFPGLTPLGAAWRPSPGWSHGRRRPRRPPGARSEASNPRRSATPAAPTRELFALLGVRLTKPRPTWVALVSGNKEHLRFAPPA